MRDENVLIFIGFLDLLSVSILVTALPLHLKSFNVSTTYIGFFFSLYGGLQIISSYLMGYLSDKCGKKFIICICALGTSIGYFLLGLAPTFIWIFIFRIISGVFKHTQTLSRAILTSKSYSDNNEQIAVMGRFSTLSTIGFIFGPPLSGYLYQHFNFFCVSCLSSLGFFIILILLLKIDHEHKPSKIKAPSIVETNSISNDLKENIKRRKKLDMQDQTKQEKFGEDDNIVVIAKKTWNVQLSIFFMSFCPLLFRTNYSLVLRELFESTSILSGFATSYGAITGSIAGLAVPLVMRKYHQYYHGIDWKRMKNRYDEIAESKLLFHISIVLTLSYLGCSLSSSLTMFILFQSPISFVNGLSKEAFNVIISKRVSKHHVGRVMGMNGSLVAFGRLMSPIVGGLMQEISYRLPIISSSIGSFFAAAIIYYFY